LIPGGFKNSISGFVYSTSGGFKAGASQMLFQIQQAAQSIENIFKI